MPKLFFASIAVALLISGFKSNTSNYGLALSDTIPEKNQDTLKDKMKAKIVIEDSNIIFTKEEVMPSIDHTIWLNYLMRSMRPYLEDRVGIVPDGLYTVHLRFLVEQDGSLKDVQALNNVGFGFKEAAVKIIQKSPKWTPARQNGRIVRCYHTQAITFALGLPGSLQ